MQRTVLGRVVLIIVAATAGCQTTGSRPIEAPGDDLTITRTFPARFDAVNLAMQHILKDHDAVRDIAGFDYSTAVLTTSQTWKTPFRKVATRNMENGDRTLTVKIEQQAEGCVVTARVSTGTAGDHARSAALLDRIGESIDTMEPVGRRSASGDAG
jgi:hypothetical protein